MDSNYLKRRAEEESDAAQHAADERARQVHAELAARYAAAADGGRETDPDEQVPIGLVSPLLPADLRILP